MAKRGWPDGPRRAKSSGATAIRASTAVAVKRLATASPRGSILFSICARRRGLFRRGGVHGAAASATAAATQDTLLKAIVAGVLPDGQRKWSCPKPVDDLRRR